MNSTKLDKFYKAREEGLDRISIKLGNGKIFIGGVPVDHLLSSGPMEGISTIDEIDRLYDQLCKSGATAILSHIGHADHLRYRIETTPQEKKEYKKDIGLIVHLNGQTEGYSAKDPNKKNKLDSLRELIPIGRKVDYPVEPDDLSLRKTLVTSVEEAYLKCKADAFSIHTNISSAFEREQFDDIYSQKQQQLRIWIEYGIYLPMELMAYGRGGLNYELKERIEKGGGKYKGEKAEYDLESAKKCAVVAYGLGADIIKLPYTKGFKEVVQAVEGVPVVLAGGPPTRNLFESIQQLEYARDDGASGVMWGRKIFTNKDPGAVIRSINSLWTKNMGAKEACEVSGLKEAIKQS